MNQLVLSARIAEAKALRYTPAGLPAIDLLLDHESEALEAGQQRQVKVEVKAVAFGATAETLARQAVGTAFRFTGFIAAARGGKHPVLHIQSFQQESNS
ncbi:primosomal replication protein N [Ramlibacter sp.]|uniref:primosomal replication protein N n=1 Tax=Ramlibacter sp. TaxID=1917967 RepID=UPI00180EB118|nr:primosomal replication protein N [Ramlibacter sp.]MBA2672135.1 primosomal replication protein N [Ramlibacter sp.]